MSDADWKPDPDGDGSEAPTQGAAPKGFGGLREVPGDRVGPYILLKIVGEGSFGVVWLAERREPIVQRVAIKIIKPGMESESVVARFEQERQALALMDHPHIAQVKDAGTSPSGRPYFVTDYVSGDPITTYCDRNRLTIRERLQLFTLVCEAIQHAHQKGVIHRDLKPANILVADSDTGPVPKIIDFGVAKALSPLVGNQHALTEVGQIIGTLNYMSPEQAEMSPDIDTRSDVYSLGIVLYEILAGMLPFEKQSFRAARHAPHRRTTREQDAPKPSTRLSTADADVCAAIAQQRREARADLLRQLAKELEWIPLKALRPDRADRYTTASELSRDIRRYLNGDPLEAAPESRIYRLRKFTRRNRGAVIAASALALVFMLGMIGTSAGLYIALEQSKLAEAESARAARIATTRNRALEYFNEVLLLRTPTQLGRNATQQEVLEHALRLVPTDTGDRYFVNQVRHTIATAMEDNGQFERALEISDRNRADLSVDPNPEEQLLLIEVDDLRMVLLVDLRRFDEAKRIALDVRERTAQAYPDDEKRLLELDRGIAILERRIGNTQQAETLYTILLSRATTLLGSNDPVAIQIQSDLISLLIDNGKPAEAVSIAKDAQRRARSKDVEMAPEQRIRLLHNSAQAAEAAGDTVLAAGWHAEALQLATEYMGLDHPRAPIVAANSALALLALGEPARAITTLNESIAAVESAYGEDEPTLVRLLAVRARCFSGSESTEAVDQDLQRADRLLTLHGEDRVGAASVRTLRESHALVEQNRAAASAAQ